MRRDQAGRPASSKGGTRRPAWRSPIFLVTVAVVVVAIGLAVVLNLRSGSSSAATTLKSPVSEIPAALARDGQTLGLATAPVTLDVWADFQCPACAKFVNTVEPQIVEKYVTPGQIRLRFNDYTFIGPESVAAAVAARCAADQNKFWGFDQYLYANQGRVENGGTFSKDFLAAVADRVGLDRATFDTCVGDQAKVDAVQASTTGGAKIGVRQTPTLSLNGTVLTFTTYEELYSQIDAAIAAAGGTPPSSAPAASAPAASAPASPSTAP